MTSPAIDFLIFGSGHGLGAPYWNQPFYWLVDAHSKRGDFYTYSAGFGAQLHSYQWRHPKPQERRRLAGMEFAPFHSRRRWGRVEVAWAMNINRPLRPEDFALIETRLRSVGADFSCWGQWRGETP